MKTLFLIFILNTTYTLAYTIISKDVNKNTVSYLIKCDNGKTVGFNKNRSDNAYHIYNNTVFSIDKAAQIGCKQINSSKSLVIKKNSLIFKKRFGNKGIENALIAKSSYSIAKLNASNNDKEIHRISSNAKVIKLEYYKPHYIKTDKYENYKENGKYKQFMIDGYYKIKDRNNNIFYVRKDEIQ